VDEDLYGGFVGNEDRRVLDRIRAHPRAGEQAGRPHPAFADERLEELLFRYRARNFPDTLNDAELERWQPTAGGASARRAGRGLSLAGLL
jgi:exodeoxyribonuclease-1